MADIVMIMKTIESFAVPKKTKAQLEAEKLLKEAEERRAKMKNTPAKVTPVPATTAPVAVKKEKKKKGILEKFEMDDGDIAGASIGSIIGWLIFFLAAYLSWTCNSKNAPTMDQVEKAFRAFVAGLFGFIYLIFYFTVWVDQCRKGGHNRVA